MSTRPPLWVMAVALALLLGLQPLTTDLYLPALPGIAAGLNATMGGVQLTMSALILGFGLAQLPWGAVSDRWGRRPVLLVGLGAYVVASAACALAPSLHALVAARAAQGAALASAVVLGRAMVRDLYEPTEGAQVMSRGMTGLGVMAIAAMPLGGGLTQWLGWRPALWAVVAVGALAWLFVAWRLPETQAQRNLQALQWGPWGRTMRQVLGHPTFWSWALLVSCTYGGLFVILSVSSWVYINTLGLSPWLYGLALGSNSLAYLVGTLWCRRWLVAHGLKGAVRRGAVFSLAGAVALLAVARWRPDSALALLAAQWLFAFGHGIHQPCGQTGAVGPFPQVAGVASATAGLLLSTLAFIIGAWLGLAFDGTVAFMAQATAVGAVLTSVVAWTLVQRHGLPPQPHSP